MDEVTALGRAMARFVPPEGWRVLWTESRAEAHWTSGGSWARYSVRFHRERELDTPDEVFLRCGSGTGRLTVTFASSDLLPHTVAAAADMLSPMHRLLAAASVPAPDGT